MYFVYSICESCAFMMHTRNVIIIDLLIFLQDHYSIL